MSLKNLIDNYGRSPEERAKAAELLTAINEEARKRWVTGPSGDEFRAEVAAVLTESVTEGFRYETLLNQYINIETVGFYDRVKLEEVTGLEVFAIAKGGDIEASQMVAEEFTLPRDTLAFRVYEFEDDLLSNFGKSMAQLRSLAVQRLEYALWKEVQKLVAASIGGASPYYSSGAGLNQAALNALIREVRDESVTGEVALVGRSPMVDQIVDFTGFSDEALEEIRLRGRLGTYRGASVITMKNFKDQDGVHYMPANELWVISPDVGKFALYGGLKTREYMEDGNWYWHFLGRQDYGGAFHRPERMRRVIDTNITA